MHNITPFSVAENIADIHECVFGGKSRGRLILTKSDLRSLSGRKKLEDSIIQEIISEASEMGLIIFSISGDYYGVIESKKCLAWRKCTNSIIERYSKKNQVEARSI